MGRNRWGKACGLAAATVAIGAAAGQAKAAVPHVVEPGETLWSISAANNFTTRTVAAFNGLPEDAQVIAGTTIEIPTVAAAAAALAAAGSSIYGVLQRTAAAGSREILVVAAQEEFVAPSRVFTAEPC